MRVWWVFAGMVYYPDGGIDDLFGTYETEEDAKKAVEEYKADETNWQFSWYRIVDISPYLAGTLPERKI